MSCVVVVVVVAVVAVDRRSNGSTRENVCTQWRRCRYRTEHIIIIPIKPANDNNNDDDNDSCKCIIYLKSEFLFYARIAEPEPRVGNRHRCGCYFHFVFLRLTHKRNADTHNVCALFLVVIAHRHTQTHTQHIRSCCHAHKSNIIPSFALLRVQLHSKLLFSVFHVELSWCYKKNKYSTRRDFHSNVVMNHFCRVLSV